MPPKITRELVMFPPHAPLRARKWHLNTLRRSQPTASKHARCAFRWWQLISLSGPDISVGIGWRDRPPHKVGQKEGKDRDSDRSCVREQEKEVDSHCSEVSAEGASAPLPQRKEMLWAVGQWHVSHGYEYMSIHVHGQQSWHYSGL